jgi:biopolymer transport protein ExbD
MARKRKSRNRGDAAQLEMTPMIDVVFQLLIFFIVTIKPEDILAKLNVARPAPDPNTTPETQVEDLLTILVGPMGYTLNGRAYRGNAGLNALDRHLTKVASYDRGTTVVIKCTGDSPHRYLVQLLNVCAREQLTNLSVFSM